jgi:cyclopropane fatty-acyl-phospholipid synthase-like methyltransferase
MSTVWHDLECGAYAEDLPVWRSLADSHGGQILEIGAGTGRVSLELARRGHRVTALDQDRELLAELERRAVGLSIETVLADARAFELPQKFGLCLVPMQTIQLLGGPEGRATFLRCARAHLLDGGVMAAALTSELEPFETADGGASPLPDMCERDGVVYASHPTAVRAQTDGFVLERRRETVTTDGRRTVERNAIALDRVLADELELEAQAAGLTPVERLLIAATSDYVGSEVVIVRA